MTKEEFYEARKAYFFAQLETNKLLQLQQEAKKDLDAKLVDTLEMLTKIFTDTANSCQNRLESHIIESDRRMKYFDKIIVECIELLREKYPD